LKACRFVKLNKTNVEAIPLAVLGFLHPVIAEIAMASSSVMVVSNANLLKRFRL